MDVGLFKNARHFAAWLGLVPRQRSTGGKARLGRITQAGNEQIRTLLVPGATSMARRAGRWSSAAGVWMRDLLARLPARRATVALANKMARIAPRPVIPAALTATDRARCARWAMMARKEDYHPAGRVTAAVAA